MDFFLKNKVLIENPTAEFIRFCRSDLIISNPEYQKRKAMGKWVGNINQEIVLFEKVGFNYLLPFGTCQNVYKTFKNDITSLNSAILPVRARNYQSNINLYDYQKNAVEAVLRRKNGILVAPCGSGKTQMGLEIAARIGGKTLWITHTLDLMNQSMERSKACFSLPLSEYGTITGGKVNIGNTITFATVQTLSNIDLAEFVDTWDTIIVDECHKCVGSPTKLQMFYKVVSALSARYKIGLTATPYRADGLTKCMYALLGDTIYTVSDADVADKKCPVKIDIVKTGYSPDLDFILNGDGTLIYSALLEDISKDKKRNQVIADKINLIQKQGAVLVLSDRIEHLKNIKELCNGECAFLGAAPTKKQKEFRKIVLQKLNSNELNVVFATYKLAKEGLDIPNLRYVVFASPQKDKTTVIQSAGRVARKSEGKTFGTVVDFEDNFGMLNKYLTKRKNFYKKLGYIG